jgi:hypothetical protein
VHACTYRRDAAAEDDVLEVPGHPHDQASRLKRNETIAKDADRRRRSSRGRRRRRSPGGSGNGMDGKSRRTRRRPRSLAHFLYTLPASPVLSCLPFPSPIGRFLPLAFRANAGATSTWHGPRPNDVALRVISHQLAGGRSAAARTSRRPT